MKKEIYSYNAIVTKDKDCYVLKFPDFDTVLTVSENEDFDQLLYDAPDVLFLALDGEKHPKKTSFETMVKQYPDAMIQTVVVDMIAARKKAMYFDETKEKVNITLPRRLKIFAKEHGINISQITRDALEEKYRNFF